jgi:hypothetical protein
MGSFLRRIRLHGGSWNYLRILNLESCEECRKSEPLKAGQQPELVITKSKKSKDIPVTGHGGP